MPFPVGISQLAGRTHGVEQVMSNIQAAYNLIAAIEELKRDYGEVVTVNEADRSRPNQWYMRTEYLAGRGPLAAYCVKGPPGHEYDWGEWTSTHDPYNHGNAADLGGPGGIVISENARQLLDGNHPRGVIGRKYGLYNTGWFFVRREIWHFNIYPARALVLAVAPGINIPLPTKEEDEVELKAMRDKNRPEVYVYATGTPIWWHVSADELVRLQERFPSLKNIEVTDARQVNTQRLVASQALVNIQIDDPDTKKPRTIQSFFQVSLKGIRK